MNVRNSLTENQRTTLANALHVAAEIFKDHSEKILIDRLAEQFKRQHTDALALAEAVEAAEEIIFVLES